jgi:hypothetical protein
MREAENSRSKWESSNYIRRFKSGKTFCHKYKTDDDYLHIKSILFSSWYMRKIAHIDSNNNQLIYLTRSNFMVVVDSSR